MYSDDAAYDVSLEVSTIIKTYSLDFITRLRAILSFITVSHQHIVCTGAKVIQGIRDATLLSAVERGGNSKSPYFSSDALKTRRQPHYFMEGTSWNRARIQIRDLSPFSSLSRQLTCTLGLAEDPASVGVSLDSSLFRLCNIFLMPRILQVLGLPARHVRRHDRRRISVIKTTNVDAA